MTILGTDMLWMGAVAADLVKYRYDAPIDKTDTRTNGNGEADAIEWLLLRWLLIATEHPLLTLSMVRKCGIISITMKITMHVNAFGVGGALIF